MKKILTALLFMQASLLLKAQQVRLQYTASDAIIVNPERGFYIPSGTKASHFIPLDEQVLKKYRSVPQHPGNASYSVTVSLLYRAYELDIFKDKALSEDFLTNLQNDFNTVRRAGLKIILRFAYTNQSHAGDCKDEYNICPPYGDAPVHIVLHHVQQLKPLLHKNADIIAVLQQGFIGIWGENYFTDYFGCATDDGEGRITDSGWMNRNLFLKALLDAMPKNRMVQVRTPQIKQRYVYGKRAKPNALPLKTSEAFTQSDKARIGFHNDCFLASADDYGTFYDYGNSISKRDTANHRLRSYFEADSRYVAVGGETCDDAYSPHNDCEPHGRAETEMRAMHYSYLNAAYNNNVNNDWDSLGCMRSIQQNLGYRLVLQSALLPAKAKKAGRISVQLRLKNTGYAAPFNPRPVQLILRNTVSGSITTLHFTTNIQSWHSGAFVLQQQFKLPAIAAGRYELLLNLPDGYPSLRSNPAYSIQLANEALWEQETGYNTLKHILVIN
ncbi:MAG TPA: DUF4832 domain-containing protein [Ferruginibacter sp.]|nr:DUF4832 domain-containing protein [Ferruginibacter sp.]HMP22316.1 DUF4832 domain-containing protein [Ferruginibacter sp.]